MNVHYKPKSNVCSYSGVFLVHVRCAMWLCGISTCIISAIKRITHLVTICEECVALVKQHVSFSMKQFYKVWIRFRMLVQCGSHVVKGFPR